MKINETNSKFHWLYIIGFFIILALPILTLPPWFYPPDWGKTIIFRSITAILLFLFLWARLQGNREPSTESGQVLYKNKIIWALAALFGVFLLASISSVDPHSSFWASPYRSGGFVTFAFYFIFAILAFILFKKDDWKKAWIVSISSGIFVSLIALVQFYGLFNNIFVSVGTQPGSTTGNPIFLGIYLLLLFFPTLSFAIKEPFGSIQGKIKKIFYIFSLLIFLYVIFIAGSRAAYFGIIAGLLYFLLFYPKKIAILKTSIALFLVIIVSIVFYVNIASNFPQVLQNNRLFQILENRLSIKQALQNERFRAWQTALKEIEDRPILGWGPENLAVGFDKNYDPLVTPSPWWDKAHNIFLDIGAQTGVLGILTYIFLFIVLFWQLQKARRETGNENARMTINGLQAVLVGYLIANFFSFDSFPTYLIFFFIIGYSLYLTNSSANETQSQQAKVGAIKGRNIIFWVLTLALIIFLWQYNLAPFQINAQINIADDLTDQKKCEQALNLLDKELKNHSFLDSYLRMKYVVYIQKCDGYYPENDLAYAIKGISLLKEAVKIQPLYTRYWLYLGSLTTIVAYNEQNQQIKENLIKEANFYFDKTEALSPLRAEIFIERTKIDMIAENYQKMESDAEKCIKINPNLGDCYWMKALAEMYQKKYDEANKNIETAKKYGFNDNSNTALYQLVDVYNTNEQYRELVDVYEKLIVINTNMPQYRSSLAFAYSKIKEYEKARYQAMIFLQMMPEAKDEVDAFLRTLPY